MTKYFLDSNIVEDAPGKLIQIDQIVKVSKFEFTLKLTKISVLNLLLLFVIVSLAGISLIFNYERLITLFLTPLLVLAGFSLNKYSFPAFKNEFVKYFLIIIALGYLLVFISIDISTALSSMQKLTGVLLCILLTVELLSFKKYDFTRTFLLGFVVAFILISLNLFLRVGIQHLNISASYIDRGEFGLNANTYSYFSFFCNMSLFYLIQLYGKKIYIILSIGCIILGVYISLVTASRSGFLFTSLIAVIYWLFIFDRVKINSLIRFLTISIIAGYGIFYLTKIYNGSYLKVRVEKASHQGDLREGLVRDAINVFEDHPVLGVGPGQFYNYSYNQNSFSHNSFAEMAANFGFIGILILLILFFKPLFLSVKNFYRKNANRKIVKLNLLFFSSFILINNIYVFYETTYGMIFFFLIIMIQKKFCYLNSNE